MRWLAAAAGGGVAALALAALVPLEMPAAPSRPPLASSRDGAIAPVPPLKAFEPLWGMNLQRPLVDRPLTPEPQEATPPPSLPALRLVGTAVEPGHSVAFFETTPGSTELKKVGDKIEGAVVSRIDSDRVEVTWRGEAVALKVVPSSPVPATPATPVLASPKPLPDPGADGIIHLFTTSGTDRKVTPTPKTER